MKSSSGRRGHRVLTNRERWERDLQAAALGDDPELEEVLLEIGAGHGWINDDGTLTDPDASPESTDFNAEIRAAAKPRDVDIFRRRARDTSDR